MKILLIFSLLLVIVYGGIIQQNELQKIIEKVNSSGAKWKAGQNFGKSTPVSSLERLIGVRSDKQFKLPSRPKHSISNSDIPESFDAREQWPQCKSIGHIRDQGNCRSDYAVSAAAVFTDRLCIATNGTFTMPISAEELLTCCHNCGFGCDGGFPELAWNYLASNGLVTGGDYQSAQGCQPYEIAPCQHGKGELPSCDPVPIAEAPKCQRNCTNPAYSTPFSSDHHKIQNAYSVQGGAEEVQKEILAHGPVAAVYTVYSDFLTYRSGIYHHMTVDFLGPHSVKLIGWGVENGTAYWLAVNQWNESWGDKGLFKILRGVDECGIDTEVLAGIPQI